MTFFFHAMSSFFCGFKKKNVWKEEKLFFEHTRNFTTFKLFYFDIYYYILHSNIKYVLYTFLLPRYN
jgi:hypothetical protein